MSTLLLLLLTFGALALKAAKTTESAKTLSTKSAIQKASKPKAVIIDSPKTAKVATAKSAPKVAKVATAKTPTVTKTAKVQVAKPKTSIPMKTVIIDNEKTAAFRTSSNADPLQKFQSIMDATNKQREAQIRRLI